MPSPRLITLLSLCALLAACGPGIPGPGQNPDAPPGPPPPDAFVDPNRPDADRTCATATYDGEQAPAALLVLLDRSASMAQNNKWTYAAQAIVAALDQDVFDSLHVGLYAAPSGTMMGPACIFGLPVACMAPPFPQIDLELAGTMKSTGSSGVRRRIRDWLTANAPDTGFGDASPLYNAIEAASGSLRFWPEDGKRILLVVSDGSISCNEFSSRPGFGDCNGCTRDWEHPQNIIDLLASANADPAQPIETFLIGVPGADTYDSTACNYPPYYMRNALSAMAAAGSPDHIPPACDGRTFTAPGANPTMSCHFDMTVAPFSATAVADAISYIRGETIGCIFDMPTPPPGETIDPNFVNVEYTFDGVTVELARRADPSNPCTATGCWDYTTDMKIELIGQACADLRSAASVQVRIITGCMTIIL